MRVFFVALAASTTLLSGVSGASVAPSVPPTDVQVDMVDIAFEPETLSVAVGQTVRFVFTNRGKLRHEALVGSVKAQKRHERTMKSGAEMDMGHGGHGSKSQRTSTSDAVTVKPGGTRRLTHTFTRPGTTEVGCHEPGHYAAGMKIIVTVT